MDESSMLYMDLALKRGRFGVKPLCELECIWILIVYAGTDTNIATRHERDSPPSGNQGGSQTDGATGGQSASQLMIFAHPQNLWTF